MTEGFIQEEELDDTQVISSEEVSEDTPQEISDETSDVTPEVVWEIEPEESITDTEDQFTDVVIDEIFEDSSEEIVEGLFDAEPEEEITATRDELKSVMEAVLFVADDPLPFKQLCKVLGDINEDDVRSALDELVKEYDDRKSGLEVREIAGGWRISTRPQNHEFIRKYLRSRPSARLSLPALETLAVIAYKQPVTIPEILEIRGVSSSSAIKTLLEKRLIVTRGRKETVGRPMMYGTSKEFLIQFGLKDLTELPSIEDFEDLTQ